MSMPDHEIQLPDSKAEGQRFVRMRLTHHGDVVLQTRSNDEPAQGFGMHHGSETMMVAAGIGYFTRLGLAKAAIQKNVESALAELLEESPLNTHMRYPQTALLDTIDGKDWHPSFDLPGDLKCLAMPMPAHPGRTDQLSSTGFYTHKDENESLDMVIAGLPPHTTCDTILPETIRRFTFHEQDIAPFISLIGECALGQYREDISALIHAYNGTLQDD